MSTETAVAPAIETKIAEYSPTAAGLAELAQRLKDRAYDLTTTKGDKEARAEEDRQAAAARAEADRVAREERAAEARRQAEERAELQRKADALAAEKRQRDEAEEMARLEAQRAAAKVEKAGPVLLAALVIAIPYVAEHGTADDLATCNAAIAEAT